MSERVSCWRLSESEILEQFKEAGVPISYIETGRAVNVAFPVYLRRDMVERVPFSDALMKCFAYTDVKNGLSPKMSEEQINTGKTLIEEGEWLNNDLFIIFANLYRAALSDDFHRHLLYGIQDAFESDEVVVLFVPN